MPRMTRAEYESYIARHTSKAPVCSDAGEREASLHYDIMQDCKQLGWLALHGSMAHKSRRTPGEFDLIIICEYPRILFVECKSKTGKLSVEQQAIFAHVRRLGWEPHVVRSMSEWCVVRTIGSTAAERLLP